MKKLTTLFAALLYSTAAFSQAGGVYTGPNQPGQVIGTVTGDSALVGNVGEVIISSVAAGAAISMTTGTPTNLANVTLTPGEWEVNCETFFTPAGTTVVSNLYTSVSAVSATFDFGQFNFAELNYPGSVLGAVYATVQAGPSQRKFNSPTSVYCVVQAAFSTSTMTVWGAIRARRVR